MAAVASSAAVIVPSGIHQAAAASTSSQRQTVGAFSGLKGASIFSARSIEWAAKTVSNSSRVSCMKVWSPIDNPRFETLSYLPPLSDSAIAKEIDYLLKNNWVPCLEFDLHGTIYRENNAGPGYYDGRYWTMWKLPMFGCNDSSQVLREIQEAKKAYPDCYIRVLGFDNIKQVQCVSFIAHKPV